VPDDEGDGLGRVDGFDEDKAADEGDECGVVFGGLLAAQGDPLEAFELADGLLDACAVPVELPGEEARTVPCVLPMRNDGAYAALACGVTIGSGV